MCLDEDHLMVFFGGFKQQFSIKNGNPTNKMWGIHTHTYSKHGQNHAAQGAQSRGDRNERNERKVGDKWKTK
jgi:hypothetical protein